jgi:hypothetical protein
MMTMTIIYDKSIAILYEIEAFERPPKQRCNPSQAEFCELLELCN